MTEKKDQRHEDKAAKHETKHEEKAKAKATPGELKPTESPGASQKEKDDLGQGGH